MHCHALLNLVISLGRATCHVDGNLVHTMATLTWFYSPGRAALHEDGALCSHRLRLVDLPDDLVYPG